MENILMIGGGVSGKAVAALADALNIKCRIVNDLETVNESLDDIFAGVDLVVVVLVCCRLRGFILVPLSGKSVLSASLSLVCGIFPENAWLLPALTARLLRLSLQNLF